MFQLLKCILHTVFRFAFRGGGNTRLSLMIHSESNVEAHIKCIPNIAIDELRSM